MEKPTKLCYRYVDIIIKCCKLHEKWRKVLYSLRNDLPTVSSTITVNTTSGKQATPITFENCPRVRDSAYDTDNELHLLDLSIEQRIGATGASPPGYVPAKFQPRLYLPMTKDRRKALEKR